MGKWLFRFSPKPEFTGRVEGREEEDNLKRRGRKNFCRVFRKLKQKMAGNQGVIQEEKVQKSKQTFQVWKEKNSNEPPT